MIDIQKQITYWHNGAIEDWDVATDLINRGKTRHGLFFAHLALEKLLKAHVCRQTQDLAPRLHNLSRLAELAKLPLNQTQLDTLADMNAFNLEGRYPDLITPAPTAAETQIYLKQANEVFAWLQKQL